MLRYVSLSLLVEQHERTIQRHQTQQALLRWQHESSLDVRGAVFFHMIWQFMHHSETSGSKWGHTTRDDQSLWMMEFFSLLFTHSIMYRYLFGLWNPAMDRLCIEDIVQWIPCLSKGMKRTSLSLSLSLCLSPRWGRVPLLYSGSGYVETIEHADAISHRNCDLWRQCAGHHRRSNFLRLGWICFVKASLSLRGWYLAFRNPFVAVNSIPSLVVLVTTWPLTMGKTWVFNIIHYSHFFVSHDVVLNSLISIFTVTLLDAQRKIFVARSVSSCLLLWEHPRHIFIKSLFIIHIKLSVNLHFSKSLIVLAVWFQNQRESRCYTTTTTKEKEMSTKEWSIDL